MALKFLMSTLSRELGPDELLSEPMLFTLCLLASSEEILFRLRRENTQGGGEVVGGWWGSGKQRFRRLRRTCTLAREKGGGGKSLITTPREAEANQPAHPKKTKENVITRGGEWERKHCFKALSGVVATLMEGVSAWVAFTGGRESTS